MVLASNSCGVLKLRLLGQLWHLRLLGVLMLCVLVSSAFANEPTRTNSNARSSTAYSLPGANKDSVPVALASPLEWFSLKRSDLAAENPSDRDGLNRLFESAQRQVWRPESIIPSKTGQVIWARFSLAPTEVDTELFLRMQPHTIDRVTLQYTDNKGRWITETAGYNIPLSSWPIPVRVPSFAIQSDEKTKTFWLRIEHHRSIVEQPLLMSQVEFIDGANRMGSFVGGFSGLYLMAIIACLISFSTYRNSAFIWLSVLGLSLWFLQFSLIGQAAYRFWPHSVYLMRNSNWGLILITMIMATGLIINITYARQAFIKCYWLLMSLALVSSVLFLMFLSRIDLGLPAWMTLWPGIHASLLLAVLTFMAWRSQQWLWGAIALLLPSFILLGAQSLYMHGFALKLDALQLVGALYGALSLALLRWWIALRTLRRFWGYERNAAEQSTDVLSSLHSKAAALQRLPNFIARSRRHPHGSAFIFLRWLMPKEMPSGIGQPDFERAWQQLGKRIHKNLRDIDLAARWDQDTVLIVLEGPLSRREVQTLIMKLVAHCLKPVRIPGLEKGHEVLLGVWHSPDCPDAPDLVRLLGKFINTMARHHKPGGNMFQFIKSTDESILDQSSDPSSSGGAKTVDQAEVLKKIDSIERKMIWHDKA